MFSIFGAPQSEESTTRRLGARGEEQARLFLERKGYLVAAANFMIPIGRNRVGAVVNAEIDLVAYEGETLCFIEVKTRRSADFATPETAVNLRKQRQITRAARAYRKIFRLRATPFRFDVVSVVMPDDENEAQIELFRGFWSESKFRKKNWSGSTFAD